MRAPLTIPLCIAALAACLDARAGGAPGDSDEQALIDEVIAGVEANDALIRHGEATYHVVSMTQVAGATREKEGELKEWFDYPGIQFEWRGTGGVPEETVTHRTVVDGSYRYQFLVPSGWGVTGPPGVACVAFVDTANRGTTGFIHPAEQYNIYWSRPPSFAKRLRWMRRGPSSAAVSAARQTDGLILVTYDPPEGDAGVHHGRYWISSHHGYCLVRVEEWPTWSPSGKPAWVYEAAARPAGNGAYVLERRVQAAYRLSDGGQLVLREKDESTLRHIDLNVRPEPSLFTIDGLGLPLGSRIRDRVHGREYLYNMERVGEGAIVVPAPSGPLAARECVAGATLIAGVLATCWLIYSGRRVGRTTNRSSAAMPDEIHTSTTRH